MRLPGVDVREVLQVHRHYVVELMQQWTRLKEDEAGFDLPFALVVDAELFRLDSVVRWLDAADGRIKRAGLEAPRPRTGPDVATQIGGAPMNLLELHGVSKSYGQGTSEVHALRDIDLSVDRGS